MDVSLTTSLCDLMIFANKKQQRQGGKSLRENAKASADQNQAGIRISCTGATNIRVCGFH
jgi:hypothetical protein